MNQEPISVILTGFGYWVRHRTVIPFLKQYPDMIRIKAITSLNEGEFKDIVVPTFRDNGWGIPKFISDIEKACYEICSQEEEKPVAVVVTTPNSLHFKEIEVAIQHNCHVYAERPVVTKDDDLQSLIDLANTKKVLFFTGTQRRLEAPFKYLKMVVEKNYNFGKLKRIHCCFTAREHLKGWRRIPELSGGGIITDSGYHLIDIAAWLVNSIGIQITESLTGAVYLSYNETGSSSESTLGVETEAFGYLELPNQILLTFDFSYNAPENSIFEEVKLWDYDSNTVSLTRNQPIRTPLPATITHQLSNGRSVGLGVTNFSHGIRVETIRFADEARNMEPLRLFVEAILKNKSENNMSMEARNSLSTWHLIREIYRLAKPKGVNK
jgi:predicted dehydrogenase